MRTVRTAIARTCERNQPRRIVRTSVGRRSQLRLTFSKCVVETSVDDWIECAVCVGEKRGEILKVVVPRRQLHAATTQQQQQQTVIQSHLFVNNEKRSPEDKF